jgi:hypothetical protein
MDVRIPQIVAAQVRPQQTVPGTHDLEKVRNPKQVGCCRLAPFGVDPQRRPLLDRQPIQSHGLSAIVVRLGMVAPGTNRAEAISPQTGPWFRQSWLSNRDYCQLMARCIEATPLIRFAIVNGVSANTGMRWDIQYTRDLLGYEPLDDVTQPRG